VKNNEGPKSRERIGLRKMAHEEQRWVREAMVRSQQMAAV
jgi:ring-1,2-phenylacetyl-CoA epoxidase subunit PaaA